MKLPTEIFGNVIVMHTPEELGEEQAATVQTLLSTGERVNVVVDLDGTESISSAGLEALLAAQEILREHKGNLKISTGNHVNRKILTMTRLDQHLEVFESVIDAVRSFAE